MCGAADLMFFADDTALLTDTLANYDIMDVGPLFDSAESRSEFLSQRSGRFENDDLALPAILLLLLNSHSHVPIVQDRKFA